jgi:cytochrome b
MPFILLFIYLNYMIKTGYQVSVFEWIILFVVGLIQLMAWFIQTGSQAMRFRDYEQVAKLKKYFREQEYESDDDS